MRAVILYFLSLPVVRYSSGNRSCCTGSITFLPHPCQCGGFTNGRTKLKAELEHFSSVLRSELTESSVLEVYSPLGINMSFSLLPSPCPLYWLNANCITSPSNVFPFQAHTCMHTHACQLRQIKWYRYCISLTCNKRHSCRMEIVQIEQFNREAKLKAVHAWNRPAILSFLAGWILPCNTCEPCQILFCASGRTQHSWNSWIGWSGAIGWM